MADKFKTNRMLNIGSVKLISAKDHIERWCDRKHCHQQCFRLISSGNSLASYFCCISTTTGHVALCFTRLIY